ncbi:MAG: hypothetical protein KY462_06070 [Actinobacteria bacterium]|nr:hypothetical protein [Actinomycetota bacterium]
MRLSLLVSAAALLGSALTVVVASPAAAARTVQVVVADGGYNDGDADGNGSAWSTVVHVGDTVRWVWHSANKAPHTVTALGLDVSFDSDRPCTEDPARDVSACRMPPYAYQFTFTAEGSYRYRSQTDVAPPVIGAIEVLPAPPAPPPPPPEAGPADEAPQPAADGQQQGGQGAAAAGSAPAPSPARTAAASQSGRIRARAWLPRVGVAPAPPETGGMVDVAPAVAPGRALDGSLGSPPSAAPTQTVTAELAADVPDWRQISPEVALTAVAVALLVLTAGAFGRLILFGPPWT